MSSTTSGHERTGAKAPARRPGTGLLEMVSQRTGAKALARRPGSGLLDLVSLRRPALPAGPRAVTAALRLVVAGLLVWIGIIHLHLWQEGYRFIPTNGPLFLLDAIAAFVLAAATLLWAAPVFGVVAAGFAASTLGALVISLTVGLFGFRESISASFVVMSIVLESVSVVLAFALASCLAAAAGSPGDGAECDRIDTKHGSARAG